MLALALKLLYYEALLALRRGQALLLAVLSHLPRILVETRYARRMERVAERLARMHANIASFERRIRDQNFPIKIDADCKIRTMLKGLKQDIRVIQCEMAHLYGVGRGGYGTVRLHKALDRLHKVAGETYDAADRLLWQIDQHDAAAR